MKAQLHRLWQSRSPRERRVLAVLVAVVAVALYLSLIDGAQRARARLNSSLPALRAQALRLNADANELERLRAAQIPPTPKTDLRTQVQAQAAASGLGGALLRIEAADANQAQVAFGSVVFADWLAWVGVLEAQNIRLSTARIEALSTPGLVGVTATFSRPAPP